MALDGSFYFHQQYSSALGVCINRAISLKAWNFWKCGQIKTFIRGEFAEQGIHIPFNRNTYIVQENVVNSSSLSFPCHFIIMYFYAFPKS